MAAALRQVHRLRRRIRRERVFRDRTNPLDLYNDSEMLERFRFPRLELLQLIDEFTPQLQYRLERKGSLPPSIQVLIALRFYASGSFQQVIGDAFGVSKVTVHKVIHRVSAAIQEKLDDYVKFEEQAEADVTNGQFFRKAGFPGILGCIDCTHVKILAPSENEWDFINRKGYHSINVQLICNANLSIMNAVVQWPGSVHDARILRQSAVFHAFENDPPPLEGHLGDSGYMNRPWLLTPYIHPRNEMQRNFNFAHTTTRATIERCNGVLKRRWHCLHGELRYEPEKACKITTACIILHNKALGLPVPHVQCGNACVHHDHNDDMQHHNNIDGQLARDALAAAYFREGNMALHHNMWLQTMLLDFQLMTLSASVCWRS